MKHGSKALDVSIAYIHGRLEAEVESFASSLGITSQELTRRVGILLLGQGVGSGNSVPTVRVQTTTDSETVEQMARRSSASKRRAQKHPTHAKPFKGVKGYWAKMTAGQRSAEMNRRRLKGQGQKQAA